MTFLMTQAPHRADPLWPSVHKLPRAHVGARVEIVLGLARDKRVIDLGFVDKGRMALKRERGRWLHGDLQQAARELVGIDFDAEGVVLANELGYNAYRADCQDRESIRALCLEPADMVVAGELIEHLDRPGAFLDAVKLLVAPAGLLVITTPNGLSLTNFLASLVGRELVNPDHVGWASVQTSKTLLMRHGWDLRNIFFYRFPSVRDSVASGSVTRRQVAIFNTYQALARPVFKAWPWLADGLILVAQLHPNDEEAEADAA